MLGLSLLIYHWLHISPGISGFIMDAVAMAAGAVILKSSFLLDSLIASACYSLWYLLFERFPPILPNLSAYPFIAAVLGGIFVGIGAGLIVRHGCASGADDSLALIFVKLTKKKISIFYVMSDFCILLLSLTYIPLDRILWSMMSVLISSGIIELLRPR